jgi:hypothetical protein
MNDKAEILCRRALLRSQLLRQSSTLSPLPPTLYTSLSTTLHNQLSTGALVSAPAPAAKAQEGPVNPLGDPAQMEGMMDGMKKQAVMMVPNMVVMQWINVFFSGFVLRESCFPLFLLFSSPFSFPIRSSSSAAFFALAVLFFSPGLSLSSHADPFARFAHTLFRRSHSLSLRSFALQSSSPSP